MLYFYYIFNYSFEHSYDKLLQIERKLVAEGSKPIRQCLRSNVSEDVLKHNFYTNKFDTTGRRFVDYTNGLMGIILYWFLSVTS